jgi:hypothetical protein
MPNDANGGWFTMNDDSFNRFILGALVMASGVSGLFFLRFWRKTHERLFAIFAIAFWLLGVNWLFLAFTQQGDERRMIFYLLRVAAFTLILYAIWDKNRTRQPRP